VKIFKFDGDLLKEIACEQQAHASDVNCVQFNPVDERMLATCSDDGKIKIWRLK
jgi:WD40 repeat protein